MVKVMPTTARSSRDVSLPIGESKVWVPDALPSMSTTRTTRFLARHQQHPPSTPSIPYTAPTLALSVLSNRDHITPKWQAEKVDFTITTMACALLTASRQNRRENRRQSRRRHDRKVAEIPLREGGSSGTFLVAPRWIFAAANTSASWRVAKHIPAIRRIHTRLSYHYRARFYHRAVCLRVTATRSQHNKQIRAN